MNVPSNENPVTSAGESRHVDETANAQDRAAAYSTQGFELEKSPDLDAPRPSAELQPGDVIGPYAILEKLGQGGMGAIYRARHTKLDKIVAVKLLPADWLKTSSAIARFQREMRALGQLEHPHVVRASDGGVAGDHHYLVMEFVGGQDLAARVRKKGPFSPRLAAKLVLQAARGLAYIHQKGMVHRDIKPSNLMLTPKGLVKIMDLGLAFLHSPEGGSGPPQDHSLTTQGQILGTPDYMAPEQWNNAAAVDSRADLYSLGCTLFYLMTGHPAVGKPGISSNPTWMDRMRAHIAGETLQLNDFLANVPAELDSVYRGLVATDPADRIQTAEEVVSRLQAVLQNLPAEAQRVMKLAPNPSTPHTIDLQTQASGATDALIGQRAIPRVPAGASTAPLPKTSSAGWRRFIRPAAWIAGGLLGAFFLYEIVIIITKRNPDGSETTTRIVVDEGSEVSIVPGNGVAASKPVHPEPPVQRERWASENGKNLFRKISPADWEETSPQGTFQFTQVASDERAILLFDPKRGITVELSDGLCKIRMGSDENWVNAYFGKWRGGSGLPSASLAQLQNAGNGVVSIQNGLFDADLLEKLSAIENIRILELSEVTFTPGLSPARLWKDRQLKAVRFVSCSSLGGSIFAGIDTASEIESITVVSGTMRPEALALMLTAPVKFLDIRACEGANDDLLPLIPDNPHLRHLRLGHLTVTDNLFFKVARFLQLEEFYLYDHRGPQISLPAVEAVASLPKLRALTLGGLFHPETLEAVAKAHNLQLLNLSAWTNPKGLEKLAQLEHLEALILNDWPTLRVNDIRFVTGLKKLRRLGIQSRGITKQDLQEVVLQCPDLAYRAYVDRNKDEFEDVGEYIAWEFGSISNVAPPKISPQAPDTAWDNWPADWPAPLKLPFDPSTAAESQQAWAHFLGLPVEYRTENGMRFRLIPPGEYTRGLDPTTALKQRRILEKSDSQSAPHFIYWLNSSTPTQRVLLNRPFYAAITETTNRQWEPFGKKAGLRETLDPTAPDAPAVQMNWYSVKEFCEWLAAEKAQLPEKWAPDSSAIARATFGDPRLPTEAEWEWLARGGTAAHPAASSKPGDLYRQFGNGPLHAVPHGPANPFGIHDCEGNVLEWCEDHFSPQAYLFGRHTGWQVNPLYSTDERLRLRIPDWDLSNHRIFRGGSRVSFGHDLPLDARNAWPAERQTAHLGFRLVVPVRIEEVKRLKEDDSSAPESFSAR